MYFGPPKGRSYRLPSVCLYVCMFVCHEIRLCCFSQNLALRFFLNFAQRKRALIPIVRTRVQSPTQKVMPHPNRKFPPSFENEFAPPILKIPHLKISKIFCPTGKSSSLDFSLLIQIPPFTIA